MNSGTPFWIADMIHHAHARVPLHFFFLPVYVFVLCSITHHCRDSLHIVPFFSPAKTSFNFTLVESPNRNSTKTLIRYTSSGHFYVKLDLQSGIKTMKFVQKHLSLKNLPGSHIISTECEYVNTHQTQLAPPPWAWLS